MNKTNTLQKRFSLALLLVYLFVLMLPVRALASDQLWDSNTKPATRQKPRLVDNADLLTDGEEKDLLRTLDSLSEKWSCNIAVLTVQSHDGSIQDFADDYFDYNGFGADYNGSGILFMLSMEDRSWAISTAGDAIYAFTDYGQEYMVNQMLEDLGEGYYSDAFETYTKICDRFLELYANGTPYDVNTTRVRTSSDYARYALFSVLIGLGVALIPILKMKADLNTVKFNTGAGGYQAKEGVRLSRREDRFLHKTVSKTPIPKDTDSKGSSFGGSSTHMSSSGTTHGGSSGHF